MIKNFFKALLSNDGSISSRRFSGLEIIQLIAVMVIGDQFFHYKLDIAVLVILIGFAGVCFGLTTWSDYKSMTVKEKVATEIVTTEKPGANETAAEVLTADKP